MGAKDITQEELLAEVAQYLRDIAPVRPGPEWFTVGELLEVARQGEPDLTQEQLRKRLDHGVVGRWFEKRSLARNLAYYRKLP